MQGGQLRGLWFVSKNWLRLSQECVSAVTKTGVELSGRRFRKSVETFGWPARGMAYGI